MKQSLRVLSALVVAATWTHPVIAEKTMSADVVIVGGGTSGLAAGVQALQGGAKVIILEKQPKVGGTGNFCEGLFAAESRRSASASM